MQHQEFTFKYGPDGGPIEADVYYLEESRGDAPRPTAILFHGGGFVVGSKSMIPAAQISKLSELGFIVVVPNYRLAPRISVYEGPVQDARDAYSWCQTDLSKLLPNGVSVDPRRMVAIGYSAGATLALLMASMEPKPRAILDFYGPLNFSDKFWHSPLPSFAHLPEFPPEFLSRVFEEPVPSWTPSALERRVPGATGPPRLDLSQPRNAWLFNALKKGFHLEKVVQDGDYDRVDPVRLFSPLFPPTAFLHGDEDTMVDLRFSRDAHDALKSLGVDTELIVIEGGNHGCDDQLREGMPGWAKLQAGFDFLVKHI